MKRIYLAPVIGDGKSQKTAFRIPAAPYAWKQIPRNNLPPSKAIVTVDVPDEKAHQVLLERGFEEILFEVDHHSR